MSQEIKMSDYFKEQVTLCGDTIEDSKFAYAVMSCEYIVNGVDAGLAICHAINNHDRLVKENKRLREALEMLFTAFEGKYRDNDVNGTQGLAMADAEETLSDLGGE